MNFLYHDIYWCHNCQYGFTYPPVKDEFILNYYRQVFRSKKAPSQNAIEIFKRRARAQYEFFNQSIGDSLTPDATIVDMGCGIGASVAYLRDLGYNAFGVEPDPVAREFCLPGNKPYLSAEWPVLERVHAVWLSHVIEHFCDIDQTFKKILALPGLEFLFMEVPNYILKELANKKRHASHLHFFTLDSFKKLLANFPLEICDIANFGPPRGRNPPLPPDKYAEGSQFPTLWDGYYDLRHPNSDWTRAVCRVKH